MRTKALLMLWILLCAAAVGGAVIYVVVREPERPQASTVPAPAKDTGNSSKDYGR